VQRNRVESDDDWHRSDDSYSPRRHWHFRSPTRSVVFSVLLEGIGKADFGARSHPKKSWSVTKNGARLPLVERASCNLRSELKFECQSDRARAADLRPGNAPRWGRRRQGLERTYNGVTRNHFFTSAAAMAINKLQNRSLRPNRKYRSAMRRLPGLVDVISPKSGSVTPLSGLLKFG
jgi:hypothetical protein